MKETLPCPLISALASGADQADLLLTAWRQTAAATPAVQQMTSAADQQLRAVVQLMLAETGDVNVDYHNVWEVLAGAAALRVGMVTASGANRAEDARHRVWREATRLGDDAMPAHRMLLVIRSGTETELEMDELTHLVEYLGSQVDNQAEVIFGHSLVAGSGASIQVLLLLSRR
ncbi:hypothetical protein GCM10023185_36550 [Hymenobacter saemangeumensis]|uniref:Tubulin/FtsZ 2-layer sandwich domain-containing protein n=1 Tax=Hymenobacter saemangeumensis TaxID=1084522 RepID=A0ABP8IRI7_9BACT